MELSGVSTEIWGPAAWRFMHAISFRYPIEHPGPVHKESMYDFLKSLRHLLPCTKCRQHFSAYFDHPSHGVGGPTSKYLDNRNSLTRWMVDLHNDVNHRLKKPQMDFEDVAAQYAGDNVCPPSAPFTQSQWCGITTMLIAGICLLVVMLIFARHRQNAMQHTLALAIAHSKLG